MITKEKIQKQQQEETYPEEDERGIEERGNEEVNNILSEYRSYLKNDVDMSKFIEASINDVLGRSTNILFTRRTFSRNAKDIVIDILGQSMLTEVVHPKQTEYDYEAVPATRIGEYLYQLPELKDFKDSLENVLTKCINYLDEWIEKYPNEIIHFDYRDKIVHRFYKPLSEMEKLIDEASTLDSKKQILTQIEEMDFFKSETLETFEQNLYNLQTKEKNDLINDGKYIEEFLKDEDEKARRYLALSGYGKDELINDKSPMVTKALVEGFGCENLKHLNLADDKWQSVAEEIARQGGKLDVYLESDNPYLKEEAQDGLEEHHITISEYIDKYPERCYLPENRQKYIEGRQEIENIAKEVAYNVMSQQGMSKEQAKMLVKHTSSYFEYNKTFENIFKPTLEQGEHLFATSLERLNYSFEGVYLRNVLNGLEKDPIGLINKLRNNFNEGVDKQEDLANSINKIVIDTIESVHESGIMHNADTIIARGEEDKILPIEYQDDKMAEKYLAYVMPIVEGIAEGNERFEKIKDEISKEAILNELDERRPEAIEKLEEKGVKDVLCSYKKTYEKKNPLETEVFGRHVTLAQYIDAPEIYSEMEEKAIMRYENFQTETQTR